MTSLPDIDIDVKDQESVLALFPNSVPASQMDPGRSKLVRHRTGMYLQNIPVDWTTGLAVYAYDDAESMGFQKIDILPNHVYDMLGTPDDLDEALAKPIDWGWFLDERFYNENGYSLTHIGNHFDLVQKYPPESIIDIAVLIALIRPGKKHLIGNSWNRIVDQIWLRDHQSYTFKKSHAVAFATLVTIHAKLIAMNLGLIE